jgi:predicted RNase H-like nuclease
VKNKEGSRQVEKIVASPVSRRYGGVQPASKSSAEMFGENAPIRRFLDSFGGPTNPLSPIPKESVFETYPVLALIALGYTLPDPNGREKGRLPKYNPARRTFSLGDWKHVCDK